MMEIRIKLFLTANIRVGHKNMGHRASVTAEDASVKGSTVFAFSTY